MRKKLLFTTSLILLLILPSLVSAQSILQNIHVSDSYHRPQLTIFTIWFPNGTILGNHPQISNIPINSSSPWTFSYVISNDITSAMNASVTVTRTTFPANIIATLTNSPPTIVEAGNRATMQLSGTFTTNGSYPAGEVFSYYFDVTVTCVNMASGQSYRSTFTIYGDTIYPQILGPTPTPAPTSSQTPNPTLSGSPTLNPTPTISPTANSTSTPSTTPTQTPTPTPTQPTVILSEPPTASPSTSIAAQPAGTTDTTPRSSPSATNTLLDSVTDSTPSPTPSIPEFSAAALAVLLLAALPAIVVAVKKSTKTKPAVALLATAILLLTCVIQISSAQTVAPMQAPTNVKFTLMYYNGTAFPTGDANAAGFTYGEMYLNVGGIMTSVSNYGSLFIPKTNLVVLRNDGNTTITVNATLKNVNVPPNIEVSMQFHVISAGSYSSVSDHWIGHDNSVTKNPVAPGQYMYLGLAVVLSQSNNVPSGTPTFNFNYSYDIEVFATQTP